MAIHDITPRITPLLAVWPGDTPPRREVLLDLERGDSITLSTLHATVHLGAHADAPSHYLLGGPCIARRELDLYIGPCQLLHLPAAPSTRVEAARLPLHIHAPRVLIRTDTYPEPEAFRDDFAALAPSLLDSLADRGVRLVGIDTPSIDLYDSKDLPAHQAAARHDLALLEGLVLTGVPEGLYELIALPLPLVGFDASPVRAVLRPLPA